MADDAPPQNADARLRALFGAPRPASAPPAAAAAVDDFFARMRTATPAEPAPAPAAPAVPRPFVVPEALKARPSAVAAIDIRQVAAAAMAKTGAFDVVEEERAAPGAGVFAGIGPRPEVSVPAGLFGGIKVAGRKKEKKPREVKAGAASLASLFGLAEEPAPHPASRLAEAQRQEGVQDSFELQRVLKIPRRPSIIDTAEDLTAEFRRPGGSMELWARQSAALGEMRRADGLFGPVGVGQGKTLISLLAANAMRSRSCVVLVPPALRAQLLGVDIPRLSKHWDIPLARIRVVAYSQLSNAKSADILEELKPDLIVADEAHNLRHRSAARTKRFLRYMKEHPGCRFVGLSGTMTRRSLHDYQHLAELALRKNSPLPNNWAILDQWA